MVKFSIYLNRCVFVMYTKIMNKNSLLVVGYHFGMIFSISSKKKKNMGTHQKCLIKLLLMSNHNICFYGEIRKKYTRIITNYSFLISPLHMTCQQHFGNPKSDQVCLCSLFVCVEVLRPSQPNGVMSSAVSLPNHMFTGQA